MFYLFLETGYLEYKIPFLCLSFVLCLIHSFDISYNRPPYLIPLFRLVSFPWSLRPHPLLSVQIYPTNLSRSNSSTVNSSLNFVPFLIRCVNDPFRKYPFPRWSRFRDAARIMCPGPSGGTLDTESLSIFFRVCLRRLSKMGRTSHPGRVRLLSSRSPTDLPPPLPSVSSPPFFKRD